MALLAYDPPTEPWLDIIYQDDYLLVANKPSGLLSVPGNQPMFYDSVTSRVREKFAFAEPVHRLDMATSGIILFALDKPAEKNLKLQFRQRTVKKEYQALVWGYVAEDEGQVDLPLVCDWINRPRQRICFQDGKHAVTNYKVLQRYANNTTRVQLYPLTGRSHQLRLHMLALAHPILGDKFYAHPYATQMMPRLALHAEKLTFNHPVTNKVLAFTVDADF